MVVGQRDCKFGQNCKLGYSCARVLKSKCSVSRVNRNVVNSSINVNSSAHNCVGA